MIRLHGTGRTRWSRPYWVLQELGVPFEPVKCRPLTEDTRTPEFLSKNPFGKVPLLEDGDLSLFESSAICMYLAENYGDGRLLPKDRAQRAKCEQWVSFAAGDLEAPLWRMAKHSFLYPEARRIPADIELAKADFLATARALESCLGEYAVGNAFTVADVMMTSTLHWASNMKLLADFPKLSAYVERHTARPSFPRELFS